MRMLNLFDGIGGFALAGAWMGWKPVASVEIDGGAKPSNASETR